MIELQSGPHMPFNLKIILYISIFLAIRLVYILIVHYYSYFHIKKFIERIKMTVTNQDKTKLKELIHKGNEQEIDINAIGRKKPKQIKNIYFYFKNEFLNIIDILTKAEGKYTININLQFFYLRLKEKYFLRLDQIKLVIYSLILTGLYGIAKAMMIFGEVVSTSSEGRIYFESAIIGMLIDIGYITFIFLIFSIFFLFSFFNVKKNYYLLIDECDNLVNLIANQLGIDKAWRTDDK